MRMRNLVKLALMVLVTLGISSVNAAQVEFVLDGYKYNSPVDIIYRTDNKKVKNPLVQDCTSNGLAVPDLSVGTTFQTGDSIHISLSSVQYNLSHGRLYLSTVLGNVICQGGVFDDVLFMGEFE